MRKVFNAVADLVFQSYFVGFLSLVALGWLGEQVHYGYFQTLLCATMVLQVIVPTFAPYFIEKLVKTEICEICGKAGAHHDQCPIASAQRAIDLVNLATKEQTNLSENQLKTLVDRAFVDQLNRARDRL